MTQLTYPFSVLIAEDEPFILDHIHRKIEETDASFKITAHAKNGKEAMESIQHSIPHVLITDIRMPMMDGLELIQFVKEQYPEVYIIVLSGYSEFSYAQQAMKYGVIDYLLKPLKTEDLKETLLKIRYKLETSIHSETRKIISSHLIGDPLDSDAHLFGENPKMTLLLICYGHLCNRHSSAVQSIDSFSYWKEVEWQECLKSILHPSDQWWVFDERMPNEKVLILSLYDEQKADLSDIAKKILEKLAAYANPLPVTICLEGHYVGHKEIWRQANRLRMELDQSLIYGQSAVLQSAINAEFLRSSWVFDSLTENKFSKLIKQRDFLHLREELYQIFNLMKGQKYTQRMLEKALIHVIELFNTQLDSQPMLDKNNKDFEIYYLVATITDYDVLFSQLWDMVSVIFKQEQIKNDSPKELIDSVEAYIKEHYVEPITLESIAQTFNFNPSYLIRQFKKYKGDTPTHYIITLRINEAKRLMTFRPELDLKQIAEIVGYSDSHYFSRTFKTTTGYSPSEYRAKNIVE